jgi:metal-sulfur cluster biosynthetic enzyme
MIQQKINNFDFFDAGCPVNEQIPRSFSVSFKEVGVGKKGEVRVVLNDNKQVGDIINDNSHKDDFYRYHDIFHYTFATLLRWSPCTRAMMKCKRKSNEVLDEIEDGARATITEEALSMVIFNEAKKKGFFKNRNKVSKTTLRIIKEMTESFEVKIRSPKEWENTILRAYEIFRFLIENKGGRIEFDALRKEIKYFSLN